MRRALILLLAAFALIAAGCGSSNDKKSSDSGSSAAPAKSTESTASADSGGGKEVEIKMQNIAFSPADVTVKVGTKIKWENYDEVPHNVTGGELKSKTFNKGGTYEYTADKAEKISYICTVHPQMQGTITVTS